MPSQPVEGKDYTVEKWREFDNFCCTKCQYSTVYWALFEKHFIHGNKHKHAWSFPKDLSEVTEPQGIVSGPVY